MAQLTVRDVVAREILDSRGYPTVEAEVVIDGHRGRAAVPSGASTGEGEALELRDGDAKRFAGKGVLKAVDHVRTRIRAAVSGRAFASQAAFDQVLRDLDGTPNKSVLGANAVLAASMAYCRAVSAARGLPTYRLLAETMGTRGVTLPVPLMNIVNGGRHADNGLAIQELMIAPVGFERFSEALRAGVEVFHRLKKILQAAGLSTAVGDEGGFAPAFSGEKPHEQAIQAILQAISDAGYKAGRDVFLALDCAASELGKKDAYQFEGRTLSSRDLAAHYSQWVDRYPILSIEDGLSEHDWEGWVQLTQSLGGRCQLVGDDLFVTNPTYLARGIEKKAANAILIKLNQIGTVSETLETMRLAAGARFAAITSHRSGETEDTFIAELAVGTDCGQIKTGSASRTDRIAKYNQLLRIEEELGSAARFAGTSAFQSPGRGGEGR